MQGRVPWKKEEPTLDRLPSYLPVSQCSRFAGLKLLLHNLAILRASMHVAPTQRGLKNGLTVVGSPPSFLVVTKGYRKRLGDAMHAL